VETGPRGGVDGAVGGRTRILVGISILWIPLAFVFDGVTVLVLPLRVEGGAGVLGLVSFVGLALAAGLQPVAGWLSDRHRDRLDRRVFLVGAAIPTLLGLWILVGSTGVAAAVVGYVALQVGGTAIQAAQQTFVPEHLPATERGQAAGFKTAFDVGGAFVAFLLLGALLASGGLVPAGVLVTALLAATILVVFLLVPATRARPEPGRSTAGLPPAFARLVIARFLFLFGTYAVGRFLVLLVAERVGVAPERAVDETGWLLALFTLTTAAVAIPLGSVADHRPHRDLMVAGALVTAAGILVLTPAAGLAAVLVGGLLMSVGTAAFVTGNWAATTVLVPARQSGRLMAIANLGTGLAAAAAGVLGPLIDVTGFVPALLVAAAASASAVVPLRNGPARAYQRETPA
jgi:MFS family permease